MFKNKRLLFVAPYKGEVGIKDMFAAPNFGLYRIKFYIESQFSDVTVDILDPNIDIIDFKAKEYNMIGFSLTHMTLEYDIALIYRAQKESPESILMAGGIEATFTSEWLLRSTPLDIVVLGEGEEIVANIIANYDKNTCLKSLLEVEGLVIKERINKIIRTGPKDCLDHSRFSHISSVFDFSKIPYRRYWEANAEQYETPDHKVLNSIRLFTSNYCPHNCMFCSSTNFLDYAYYGEYSKRKRTNIVALESEDIIKMIHNAVIANHETQTIIFDDDNFMMSLRRVRSICESIIEYKKEGHLPNDLTFICQARIDNFKSEKSKDVITLMKRANFRMIMFGVESFSEKVLEEFGKNTDPRLIENVLLNTQKSGIEPLIYLILFSPKSSMDDLWITLSNSLNYLNRGMEISLNFYIMDIPGSHYQKIKGLIHDYHEIPVYVDNKQVTKIKKSNWIYPFDDEVRKLAKMIEKSYSIYEDFFKKKFKIKHVPGRVYSFIIFYAILDITGLENDKNRLLKFFQRDYT
jgi:radical SAM superfamily enzyme YgiQ (UPF0313 family)